MTLTARLDELADKSRWDFSDLRALFINCTPGFDGSATLLPGVTPTSGGSVDLVASLTAGSCTARTARREPSTTFVPAQTDRSRRFLRLPGSQRMSSKASPRPDTLGLRSLLRRLNPLRR